MRMTGEKARKTAALSRATGGVGNGDEAGEERKVSVRADSGIVRSKISSKNSRRFFYQKRYLVF
jgi:hypothetical protein